jgi:predicted MFS family arabinose efflux permease
MREAGGVSTAAGPDRDVPTFRSVLRHRRLRRLLVAHVAGTIAQQVLTLAVGLHVLDRTASGLWVSITIALAFAPYALLSGYAGTLADRCSRSTVLAWSSALRAGCALLLTLGMPLGWPLPVIVVLAAAAAVAATPSYPALAAATPQCVPNAGLPAANALVTGLENVGWIAGPGAFGLVLLAGQGPVAAVAAAAVLFGLAADAAIGVGLPRPARPTTTGWHADLLAATRLVAADPRIRRPMAVLVVDNLLYGYLVVAITVVGAGPGAGPDSLGSLNTALTVGALLAMAVINRFAGSPFVLGMVMAGFGAAVLLLGLGGTSPVAVLAVGCAGAATLAAEVIGVTMVQRAAPEAVHARVFGIYDQLAVASIALGSLVAGPLCDALGAASATLLAAVVALLASAATVAPMLRIGRR